MHCPHFTHDCVFNPLLFCVPIELLFPLPIISIAPTPIVSLHIRIQRSHSMHFAGSLSIDGQLLSMMIDGFLLLYFLSVIFNSSDKV